MVYKVTEANKQCTMTSVVLKKSTCNVRPNPTGKKKDLVFGYEIFKLLIGKRTILGNVQ